MDYRTIILEDSPVWYSRLGTLDGTGKVIDERGNFPGELKGTVTVGAPGLLTGDTDPATSLNGAVGNYIKITGSGGAFNLDGDGIRRHATIEAVIKTTVQTNQVILDRRNSVGGFVFFIHNDHTVAFLITYNGVTTRSSGTINITDGVPHHVAAVLDRVNDKVRIFVDGVEDTVEIATGAVQAVSIAVAPYIGAKTLGTSGLKPFSGTIDELAFYKKCLDPRRVAIHSDAAHGTFGERIWADMTPNINGRKLATTRIAR